jgi:hypothetical protein
VIRDTSSGLSASVVKGAGVIGMVSATCCATCGAVCGPVCCEYPALISASRMRLYSALLPVSLLVTCSRYHFSRFFFFF